MIHSTTWHCHCQSHCYCPSHRANSGAILEKMIEILPEVADAIAKPLQNTEKMVFVNSTSGGGGGVDTGSGLSAFAKDFKRVVAEVPEVVNALTGVNLQTSIQQLASSSTAKSIMHGVAEGLSSGITQSKFASHDEAGIRNQYSYNANSHRNSDVGNVQEPRDQRSRDGERMEPAPVIVTKVEKLASTDVASTDEAHQ